jgi:molybdopterin synthase sulfur carrier subunit
MKILYFAWLRQKIGLSEETVTLPPEVATVAQLIDWLKGRSTGHADAFANPGVIRAAVNMDFAEPDEAVAQEDEIAFFPPVTGG